MFLPLLKDVPFAKALNVTLGSRYSNYSNFGNTVNSKVQVEWRPMDDLLFRGTVAEVFRAPSITDLFAGPAGNAPQAQDPCVGYTNDPAHAGACGRADRRHGHPGRRHRLASGLAQINGVVSGSAMPATTCSRNRASRSTGAWSMTRAGCPASRSSLDYWRLYLNDTITTVGAQTVLDACYQNNGSPFCPFINRFADGQVNFIAQPTVNLGRLDAKGWDLALRYKLPDTAWGSWQFGFDGTYIAQWDNDVDTTTDVDAGQAHRRHTTTRTTATTPASAPAPSPTGTWVTGRPAAARVMSATFEVGNDDIRQGTSADAACAADPQFCYEVHYRQLHDPQPATWVMRCRRSTRASKSAWTTSPTSSRRSCTRTTCSMPTRI